MALVDETIFFLLIVGLGAAIGYAAYLRLFVVRKLRRRMDQLVDRRLEAAAPAGPAAATSPAELSRVQERLAVLERIVTDPAQRTAEQIDALR